MAVTATARKDALGDDSARSRPAKAREVIPSRGLSTVSIVVTNQTAVLCDRADFPAAENMAARVLERSPGLTAEVRRSSADWEGEPFASIVFSIDYGRYIVDWRVHQRWSNWRLRPRA